MANSYGKIAKQQRQSKANYSTTNNTDCKAADKSSRAKAE
jgi:hypothetical protein